MKSIAKHIAILGLAVTLCCGAALPEAAFARSDGDKMPGFTRELTARQQATVKKIWSETAATRKELRKALAGKRGELGQVMKSQTPDKSKIESISREIGELRGKLLVEGLETHARLVKANLPVAQIKFNDRGGRFDGNNMLPKLNSRLTAEQKAKGQKILDANAARRKEIQDAITAKRDELKTAMQSAEPDTARIESLSAEIGELRGKMLAERVELRDGFKKAGLPDNALERGSRGKADGKKDGVKKERKDRKIKEAREYQD